jgi:hypothetical protein
LSMQVDAQCNCYLQYCKGSRGIEAQFHFISLENRNGLSEILLGMVGRMPNFSHCQNLQ